MISQFAKNFPIFKGLKIHTIATPRQEKIWIRNLDELSQKIKKFKHDKIQNLDIVTDYDYTLTKHRYDGNTCHSLFGLWGQSKYLPEDFKKKLIKTYEIYGPYETDQTIPFSQKLLLLDEFYNKQKKLFCDYSITKNIVEKVINESNIVFRYGAKYFFNKSAQWNLPIYIISGGISDILYNTIYSIVKDKSLENLSIFANKLIFKNDYIDGFDSPTIHSYNKFQIIPERVNIRKNCILMGDLVSDIYMTRKARYQSQISIFYAKQQQIEQRKSASKIFDIIVQSDQSLRFVIFLLNYIKNQSLDMDYIQECHKFLHKKLEITG